MVVDRQALGDICRGRRGFKKKKETGRELNGGAGPGGGLLCRVRSAWVGECVVYVVGWWVAGAVSEWMQWMDVWRCEGERERVWVGDGD